MPSHPFRQFRRYPPQTRYYQLLGENPKPKTAPERSTIAGSQDPLPRTETYRAPLPKNPATYTPPTTGSNTQTPLDARDATTVASRGIGNANAHYRAQRRRQNPVPGSRMSEPRAVATTATRAATPPIRKTIRETKGGRRRPRAIMAPEPGARIQNVLCTAKSTENAVLVSKVINCVPSLRVCCRRVKRVP
jgi:hypothetical protein